METSLVLDSIACAVELGHRSSFGAVCQAKRVSVVTEGIPSRKSCVRPEHCFVTSRLLAEHWARGIRARQGTPAGGIDIARPMLLSVQGICDGYRRHGTRWGDRDIGIGRR